MINYSVFHPIINRTLGFRECAILINIAKETNSRIEIHANGKVGSTDSIISLVSLGVKENAGVVFSIYGENQIECCHRVMDIMENGWHVELIKRNNIDDEYYQNNNDPEKNKEEKEKEKNDVFNYIVDDNNNNDKINKELNKVLACDDIINIKINQQESDLKDEAIIPTIQRHKAFSSLDNINII